MWVYTFASLLFNDRGTIPSNIGNNILITNNVYITKNSLSCLISIPEFSTELPISWTSDLLREVKDKVPGVVVDFVFKNKRYWVDRKDTGLQSRIRTWSATVENPNTSARNTERASRLLHSCDIIFERVKTYHTRTYIVVRADTGVKLGRASDEVCTYLDKHHCIYKCIKSNLQMHLEHIAMISDKSQRKMKDIPYTLQTIETLSESLPITQGMNDVKGTLIGLNKRNFAPYYIDFRSSAAAKNIYLGGASGYGKTFLGEAIILDMYAQGYGVLIMDIKGNEFNAFTSATGGIELGLSYNSPMYVNTFVWKQTDAFGDNIGYADKMMSLSKEMLLIISGMKGDEAETAGALLDSFLLSMYTNIGALKENPNTWTTTERLNPFVVFEHLERYMSYEMRNKYGITADRLIDRLRVYISRNGSNSHMFREPINYADIFDTSVLTFNFGMIENTNMQDSVAFKLKFLFMRILSDEYGAYRKRNGLWTVVIMEEVQIVDDDIMALYTKAITLGRAQNKINILLGNSLSALANNKVAAPMLENFSIYIMGRLNESSRNYAIHEFGLSSDDADDLERIAVDPEYEYTFLLVNKMQKRATTALLSTYVPDRVSKGKLFKVVDTDE